MVCTKWELDCFHRSINFGFNHLLLCTKETLPISRLELDCHLPEAGVIMLKLTLFLNKKMVWCSLAVKTILHSEIILEGFIFQKGFNFAEFCKKDLNKNGWEKISCKKGLLRELLHKLTKQRNKTQAALNYSALLCKICWCKHQLNLYFVLRNFVSVIGKMIPARRLVVKSRRTQLKWHKQKCSFVEIFPCFL